MNTVRISILNPKAKGLLRNLADLNLIAIQDNSKNGFANVLKKYTNRSSDFAFRLGGEEFGIITRLDKDKVIHAIKNRPITQNVIITGRGAKKYLEELADTFSEVKSVKHAFNAGIKAQRGIEW